MGIALLTLPLVKAFGNNPRAWSYTFAVFGVLSVILFLFTFSGTKERVKPADKNKAQENIPVKTGIKVLLKNEYWILITITLILIFIAMTINGGAAVYYAQTILNNKDLVGVLSTAANVSQIVAMMLIAGLIKKYGKRNVMIVGSLVSIVGYVMMLLNEKSVNLLITGSIVI